MNGFLKFTQALSETFGLLFGIILFGIGCLILLYGFFFGPWAVIVAAFPLIGFGAFIAAKNA
jgi:hypothetical protein